MKFAEIFEHSDRKDGRFYTDNKSVRKTLQVTADKVYFTEDDRPVVRNEPRKDFARWAKRRL